LDDEPVYISCVGAHLAYSTDAAATAVAVIASPATWYDGCGKTVVCLGVYALVTPRLWYAYPESRSGEEPDAAGDVVGNMFDGSCGARGKKYCISFVAMGDEPHSGVREVSAVCIDCSLDVSATSFSGFCSVYASPLPREMDKVGSSCARPGDAVEVGEGYGFVPG
jgi:hypothetical protein